MDLRTVSLPEILTCVSSWYPPTCSQCVSFLCLHVEVLSVRTLPSSENICEQCQVSRPAIASALRIQHAFELTHDRSTCLALMRCSWVCMCISVHSIVK